MAISENWLTGEYVRDADIVDVRVEEGWLSRGTICCEHYER